VTENAKFKYYYLNKYHINIVISMVVGVLITLLLYNFIGFDESNRIMSKEMLLAIKQYNINLDDFIKQRFAIRIIEFIGLIMLFKTKYSNIIKIGMIYYIGLKISLVLTVFVIEMQFIGIINYFIISFPHEYIYLYCIFKLLYLEDCKGKYGHKKALLMGNYMLLMLIWSISIASETVLKYLLVQKVFIIL